MGFESIPSSIEEITEAQKLPAEIIEACEMIGIIPEQMERLTKLSPNIQLPIFDELKRKSDELKNITRNNNNQYAFLLSGNSSQT